MNEAPELPDMVRQAPQSHSILSMTQPATHREAAQQGEIVALTSCQVLSKHHGLSSAGVPFGALITPLPSSDTSALPLLRRAPTACAACGAYLHLHCKVHSDNTHWECSFCTTVNTPTDAHDLRSCPELRAEAVDYLQHTSSGLTGSCTAESLALVVDVTAEADTLHALQTLLMQVLQHLPRTWRLILLTFGSAVSIWHLGNANGLIAADVVSGHWQGAKADSAALPGTLAGTTSTVDLPALQRLHIAALQSCQQIAEQIISSCRPLKVVGPSREQPRCLGSALAVALHLLAANNPPDGVDVEGLPMPTACRPSRVLLVTTGPATKGPGWVPFSHLDSRQGSIPTHPQAAKNAYRFFEQMTQQAVASGTAVDVLAVGQAAMNVPLLGPLTQETGGAIMAHQGFGGVSSRGLAAALQRRQGVHGFLDVHTSTGLKVAQLVGPLTPLSRTQQARHSLERHSKPTLNACQMVSVETGQGIAAALDVSRTLQGSYAYIQVILSWQCLGGGWLQRVVTKRLAVTSSLQAVLTATDWNLATVLAAKRLVRSAQANGAAQDRRAAEALRKQIGKQVSQVVCAATGAHPPWGAISWLAPPPPTILPSYLTPFAQAMYQLQRGPLLGDVAGHADERALLYATILAAATPTALHMATPVLYTQSNESAPFERVPALDLALQPGMACILDCGSQIFASSGQCALPSAGAAQQSAVQLQKQIDDLIQDRVPPPGVLITPQGSPDMRFLSARLMPTRHDSLEEQQQQFPALSAVSASEAETIQTLRPISEEPSFFQWLKALNINPTGAAQNLVSVMHKMSVSNLVRHDDMLQDHVAAPGAVEV